MNIKSSTIKDIKGLKNVWYNLAWDHSKWVVTENDSNSCRNWTCICEIFEVYAYWKFCSMKNINISILINMKMLMFFRKDR